MLVALRSFAAVVSYSSSSDDAEVWSDYCSSDDCFFVGCFDIPFNILVLLPKAKRRNSFPITNHTNHQINSRYIIVYIFIYFMCLLRVMVRLDIKQIHCSIS